MKPDSHKTKVIFRTHRDKSREVLAVFPELPSDINGYHCTCYAHIGQHGGGDPLVLVQITRPATEEESAPLARELERLGYNLEPVRRFTARMDRARMTASRTTMESWHKGCTAQA